MGMKEIEDGHTTESGRLNLTQPGRLKFSGQTEEVQIYKLGYEIMLIIYPSH